MKTAEKKEITYKEITLFWLPLALTWLMMAIEQPFIQRLIADLPDQKNNLAAFTFAYAIALIIEAPVIMLMSASTALVEDRASFLKLRKYSYILCAIITLILLILLIPAIFDLVIVKWVGLDPELIEITYTAILALIPWGGAIGYRRLYQGILIRKKQTRKVTYGTFVRLAVMAGSALLIGLFDINGTLLGAMALSLGVIAEAIAIRLMANVCVKEFMSTKEAENREAKEITLQFFMKFYTPLAMTSILTLGVHPFVALMINKSRFPIESMAALGVVNAITFLFRSLGLAYQEVNIALIGDNNRNYIKLRNFATFLGLGVTGGLSLIAFTPVSGLWLEHISNLKPELFRFAAGPLMILAIIPGLSVLQSFQRSCLVNSRKTGAITTATFIEVVVIGVTLWISVSFFDAIGVYGAAISYLIGRVCANLYLMPKQLATVSTEPEAKCA